MDINLKKNKSKTFSPAKKLAGECVVPGDKSISHRSVIFGSIAQGTTEINNFLPGLDCRSTIACFRQLGVEITEHSSQHLTINGKGLLGLKEASNVLDVGNSGTTIRLMSGLLAGSDFYSVLTGDTSIRKRPMERVRVPLVQMGAKINGRQKAKYAPLSIIGNKLTAIDYQSPVASAQVKSAILLAGLWAEGVTSVTEPAVSRDHTEKMLQQFGAELATKGKTVRLKGGGSQLTAQKIDVPGDISSAAFLIVAACILPNTEIIIKNVGVNPTRTGIIDALLSMNAKIELTNQRLYGSEPVADIVIRSSNLQSTEISGELIPRLIDEIPILCVAAACAKGTTVIKDAEELRVKETDRIQVMHEQLKIVGITTETQNDGMTIIGGQRFTAGLIDSMHDHRIGMAFAVAALIADGDITVANYDAVDVSFPGFAELISSLR